MRPLSPTDRGLGRQAAHAARAAGALLQLDVAVVAPDLPCVWTYRGRSLEKDWRFPAKLSTRGPLNVVLGLDFLGLARSRSACTDRPPGVLDDPGVVCHADDEDAVVELVAAGRGVVHHA
jgi:hypothetical protein